jgi:hypothetical protein
MQPISELIAANDQAALDEAIRQFREAFQAAAQAMARTAPPPVPPVSRLNRHERRRLAALARKR